MRCINSCKNDKTSKSSICVSLSLCKTRHERQMDLSGAIDPSFKGKYCPHSFLLGSQVMLSSAIVCYFCSVFVYHATSRLSAMTNNPQTTVFCSI